MRNYLGTWKMFILLNDLLMQQNQWNITLIYRKTDYTILHCATMKGESHMKKKIFAIIAATALILSACGNSADKTEESTPDIKKKETEQLQSSVDSKEISASGTAGTIFLSLPEGWEYEKCSESNQVTLAGGTASICTYYDNKAWQFIWFGGKNDSITAYNIGTENWLEEYGEQLCI